MSENLKSNEETSREERCRRQEEASRVGRGQGRVGKEAAETGAPFLVSLSCLESQAFCHFRLILDSVSTKSAVFCPSPVHRHGCFHFSKKHLSRHYF